MVYKLIDIEKMKGLIREAGKESDLVIVNVHWGVEYKHQHNKIQAEYGRAFIDAGADLVIGHHPHVVQGMEIYNGKPIFYSLGNFVFDQYFSSDTQEGLAVGIEYGKDGAEISLYPMESKSSIIGLMQGKERESFLRRFIGWSNIDNRKRKEIESGVILLTD